VKRIVMTRTRKQQCWRCCARLELARRRRWWRCRARLEELSRRRFSFQKFSRKSILISQIEEGGPGEREADECTDLIYQLMLMEECIHRKGIYSQVKKC
jgi:hypothetical protein